jgi:hypothetical protein
MRRSWLPFGVLLTLTNPLMADDKPARLEAFVVPNVTARPADSDAPLAEGWPGGTAPGMIEVKKYPAYRSAVARGKGGSMGADTVLFYPLFNHISRSDIAMTTPVVSNYAPEVLRAPRATGEVSMEFVYRSTTQGQVGQGVGSVKVEDHAPATYVCLGVQGTLEADKMRQGVEALEGWLAAHKAEWVADGPARRLGYHGPMTPRDERLWEVQIPVKPAPRPDDKPRP